jgi:hypothetical protein
MSRPSEDQVMTVIWNWKTYLDGITVCKAAICQIGTFTMILPRETVVASVPKYLVDVSISGAGPDLLHADERGLIMHDERTHLELCTVSVYAAGYIETL